MNLVNLLTKNSKALAAGTLFSLALNNSLAQNRSMEFEKSQSFEYLKNKAKKENKIILIDCYTTRCGPCKWMDKNVFTNDSVADFYNKNFINVKFDIESDSGKIIKEEYNIGNVPTFLYFSEEGRLLHEKIGRSESPAFIEIGKQVLNSEMQITTLREKYEKGEKDTGFIYNYIKTLDSAGIYYENVLVDYFKTQKKENLISKTTWNIIFMGKHGPNTESKAFDFLLENKEKFNLIYPHNFVENKILDVYSFELSALLESDRNFDSVSYEKWKNRIKKQNFHGINKILLDGDLQYSEKIENWNEFAKNAILLIDEHGRNYDARKLNSINSNFYYNIKDISLLEKALVWARRSIELENKAYNNDTYASLLYITGETEKAKKIQKTAIKLAREDNNKEQAEYLEIRLKNMEAGKKL